MCILPNACMRQTSLISKSFNKLLACFPRMASFPATKISIKINPPSWLSAKKKLLKFPLKYFRNLISCLSRGVWKQPESLSPEGRPKTGSLNQCQHTCQWAQNRSDRCSPSPSKLLSDVSQCWYHIQAEKHRAKVQNMKRWDVSKFPAQNGMLFTTANMIFTHITPISPWWLVTIT